MRATATTMEPITRLRSKHRSQIQVALNSSPRRHLSGSETGTNRSIAPESKSVTAGSTQAQPVGIASAETGAVSELSATTYRWILSPAIDLLFCCGGIVWILFTIHHFFIGSRSISIAAQSLITISAIGTIFLGETHTVASFVRLYKDEGLRARFPVLSTWSALGFCALALGGCLNAQIPPVMAKIYLLIVSQHFTKQAYGIILLYCLKRNYPMLKWDRRILVTLMQSTMWFAIIKQFTYKAWSGDTFLEQKIPFWGPLPELILLLSAWVLALAVAAFICRASFRMMARGEVFPLPAAMIAATAVLMFALGKEMTGTLWLYIPAFFHGSQYLTVSTSVYLKEQGIANSVPRNQIGSLLLHKTTLRYFGFLVLSGIAVFIGFPRILEQFGFNYAMATCAVFTCVQFHHVLVDHAIWRLKDPETRQLLLA